MGAPLFPTVFVRESASRFVYHWSRKTLPMPIVLAWVGGLDPTRSRVARLIVPVLRVVVCCGEFNSTGLVILLSVDSALLSFGVWVYL